MSEYKLEILAGSTFKLDFGYQDTFGRYNDLTGYTARMQMRKGFADLSPAFSFTTADSLSIIEETATVTFASGSCVMRSHNLAVGEAIKFTTTGALPTGVTPSTTYYVVDASMTTDSLKFSATPNGTPVSFNEAGNGVHTLTTVAKGVVRISIPPAVTSNMHSLYVYDLEIESGGGEVTRLVYGIAQIVPEATK